MKAAIGEDNRKENRSAGSYRGSILRARASRPSDITYVDIGATHYKGKL
jgi:hypothetical protein